MSKLRFLGELAGILENYYLQQETLNAVFRKEVKSRSGIVWLEDVIQCITLSSMDISMDLGKGSSETVLRTWLALWIIFWLPGMAAGMAEVPRCAWMCPVVSPVSPRQTGR